MGSIRASYEPENELTIFAIVDEVTVDEIIEQITAFLTRDPTLLVLWDFSEGTLARLTRDEMHAIIGQTKAHTVARRGGKTAFVCPRELDYGLARMFQTLAEMNETPFEIGVFRRMDSARKWLGVSK